MNFVPPKISRKEFKVSRDTSLTVDKKVLVLYIGGTIGMQKDETKGWIPCRGLLSKLLDGNSKFHDENALPGTMPKSQWGKVVNWHLQEREELLDSSDMDHTDWKWIALEIQKHYSTYDGFVVIQGTDTLVYTACALSFMLQYLSKTVIVTGSMVPMIVQPNDAESNLFGSICIAGHFEIPEVCVFFNNVLTRGNRTAKSDAEGYNAFVSYNYPNLLTWGPKIEIDWTSVRTPTEVEFTTRSFSTFTDFSTDVAVIRFFPCISEATMRAVLQPPTRGLVLTTYGQGNVSMKSSFVMKCLKEAHERGVLMINVTQCSKGAVTGDYATGKTLTEIGVQSGHDITVEAALCKLCWLLGSVDQGIMTLDEARKKISLPLRGELTSKVPISHFSFKDGSFVNAFVKTMNKMLERSDTGMERDITDTLFPMLLCNCASQGSVALLENILSYDGIDVNVTDKDGRTALIHSVLHNHIDCVRYLLEICKCDASIADTKHKKTALDYARSKQCEDITLLLEKHMKELTK